MKNELGQIPTGRGPIWAWYKQRVGLEDNPFWDQICLKPFVHKKRFWWHIAWVGKVLLLINLIGLAAFLAYYFQYEDFDSIPDNKLGVWLQPWGIMWMILWQLLIQWMPIFFWGRAVMCASSEARRPEGWELFLTTPLTFRQLYWAKMTPVLRETAVFFLYLVLCLACVLAALLISLIREGVFSGSERDEALFIISLAGFFGLNGVLVIFGGLLLTGAISLTKRTTISAFGWAFGVCLAVGVAGGLLVALTEYTLVEHFLSDAEKWQLLIVIAVLTLIGTATVLASGPLYVRWLDKKRDPAGVKATPKRV